MSAGGRRRDWWVVCGLLAFGVGFSATVLVALVVELVAR